MRHRAALASIAALTLVAAACSGGHGVIVRGVAAAPTIGASGAPLSKGGARAVNIGVAPSLVPGSGPSRDPKCATNSNPSQGFTASTIKWGTIIPLTGSLRPLGEQTIRVMRIATERLNHIHHLIGPYPLDWGCSERPGIYGRRVILKVFSLQANTPEEALAGTRRLIDVDKVFLMRDCYLQSNLMGPGTQYQNQKGVPAIWCYFSEMTSALGPWNFSPGVAPGASTAIHLGNLIRKLGRQRLAVLADPSASHTIVAVARRVAAHLGHPIPDGCIVYTKAQDTSQGMRSQITRIRTCYGAGRAPDAVMALDALNAVFGALEARDQGWRGADVGVQWDCSGLSCWVTSLAQLCGDACQGMLTDTASLPAVPWADPKRYPSAGGFEEVRRTYLPNEPQDILTYGPVAIADGIALWLTMTGPDLSRQAFRHTLEGLDHWDVGIGPVITISLDNHFGASGVWLIRYTGSSPWFDDVSHGFLTFDKVGVSPSDALVR